MYLTTTLKSIPAPHCLLPGVDGSADSEGLRAALCCCTFAVRELFLSLSELKILLILIRAVGFVIPDNCSLNLGSPLNRLLLKAEAVIPAY